MTPSFGAQLRAVMRRDLDRERRSGEVLWITIPFGAIALILVQLSVGADVPVLRDLGPGLYWAVVLLFGVLISVRRTTVETQAQRDLVALLGIDPAAAFAGRALASSLLLLGFQLIVGAVAVLFYDIRFSASGWLAMALVLPLAAYGLAVLGTLAGSIATRAAMGPALIPLIVAPLAVPLLLAATESVEGLRNATGILPWVLLMITVDLVLSITGVLTARPLMETQ
ncbi:MAG: heme exporter protein CcmB [Acidimicrobiia bacterium]|nr:heme exporter protein CcmB [Acidimicrobiia bacterium]